MGSCVQAHALLSALVLRIEREGFVVPDSDLATLLDLGIPETDIAAALERSPTDASRAAVTALRRVARQRAIARSSSEGS